MPNAHTSARAVARTVAEEARVRRLLGAVVVAAMVMLSGCGHQVTGLGEANNGIVPAGQTQINFQTVGQPDFYNFKYLIVINTNGNGHVPYAAGYNSNYADWSFAFFIGGSGNLASSPIIYQYFNDTTAAQGVNFIQRPYATGQLQFQLLSTTSAAQYGFSIRFNRCLLDYPSPINTTGAPTPAPSAHPSGTDCPPYYYLLSPTWVINMFTIDTTNTPYDSLGNGPSDLSYPGFIVDTSATISNQSYVKPLTGTTPQNPSGAIYGIQVFSTP
jgi:hypothetical protein